MHDWKNIVRERIINLRLQGPAESDLVEEIGQHLEDKYRELLSGGVPEPEAYRQTAAELDSLYPLQARLERSPRIPKHDVALGDTSKSTALADVLRDIRYCGRSMNKNPVFVLFAILPLALGIGANTAVFSIFNKLILNPLPVPASENLAAITMTETKDRSKTRAVLPMSYSDLRDFQAHNETFASIAGYTNPRVVTLNNGGASERMFSELVTGDYFATLELRPALGRFFAPEEDSAPGTHAVAVLNYATWQGRFGGNKEIIGKSLRLNNVVFTIIGVAPAKFIGMNALFGPDLWSPSAMAAQLFPNEMNGIFADRAKGVFEGVGRLKPGMTRAQANADIARIATTLAREYPETDAGHSATVRPVSEVIFGSSGNESTSVLFGTIALLAVVAIVLLIACSNVASLLLARAASRQQELAVRLAIGASRTRLVRQLLTENVILGLLSGLAGIVFGYAALQLLWSKAIPAEVAANMIRPQMDIRVLAYALAISVITGLLFGTIPALQASRTSVVDALKEESHAAGRSRTKASFGKALLVGQIALSFLLLVTGALFLRSIAQAYQVNPGFQTSHLALFLTNPGQAGYGPAETKTFYKDVRERVSIMPGVQSVSWASNLPLWGRLAIGIQIEGRQPRTKSEALSTILNTVDMNYFDTAGISLEQGRAFTAMDTENSTPVAVINEKMARDYWPDGVVLGKRIQLPGETFLRQIIGIARTTNYTTLGEPPQPCVYVPLAQHFSDSMTLYVRSKAAPDQILMPVQREMRTLGPRIMLNDVRTGRTIIDNGLYSAKIGVGLFTFFGLLALGLASIGLYGAVAYSVSQRKREMGVRMALGAAREIVLRLILKEGLTLVVTGMLIGYVAALILGRLLSRMLFGVSASDPASVVAASIVLLAVAMLACYLPARWASRVDPLVALREG